jgi:hypothetical protein
MSQELSSTPFFNAKQPGTTTQCAVKTQNTKNASHNNPKQKQAETEKAKNWLVKEISV